MKKLSCPVIAIVILLLAAPFVFSQGIQSTIVNLPLSGNWKQAADIEKECVAPGVQVFYDQNTGTVLQIRNDYQIRAVNEIAQQFKIAGQSSFSPDGARILMMSMFPLPSKYLQSISGNMHEGHVPKLWETKDAGNAQWFYVSQLFGGYRLSGGGKSSEVQEQFMPMRVTLAENKSAGRGDALLFEAETDKPAPEVAIRRFKLPIAMKDQKLRYGWIQFSPGGLTSSESIISLAFATPLNSGIDVKTVLDQILQSYNKPADVKN